MLILSRKKNEDIVIPELGITITLVDIRGDKARLGITADPSIQVHRAEVWAAIQSQAAQRQADDVTRANGNHDDGGIAP